ncbi:MAG TPA: flagellar motor protein MotB [Gemmatimonadales bacterium]|nr:flagellar motor protein MotB [Gemmatimonadales bacterium]
MKPAFFVTLAVALLLGAVAAWFYEGRADALARAASLTATADSLTTEASELRTANGQLQATLDSQAIAASAAKEAEIQRLKATYAELEQSMRTEITQGQVQITRLADQLRVSLVDRILFPSGEADITPAGLKVLARVGKVLKATTGKIVRVEGHTDNVAISPALRKTFPTNWELSTARATNVVRFLQDSVGIEPARLQAVGLSEYHPIASNDTPKGRGQNRRIEIGLLPQAEARP